MAYQDTNPFNKHAWEHTYLVYEYRCHQYEISKHNNGCLEEPLWKQHQEAQDAIDYEIEHENDPIKEWKYKGSADEAFDLFCKMCEEYEEEGE